MGLLKAGIGSVKGVLADQWREYFYCDSLEDDVLVLKSKKRVKSKFGTNKKGEDNIISNGSIIAVNDGQCMIIVDQGKVVDICAEPGEFVYDTSTEASIFYGDLSQNVKSTFNTIGKRFGMGGDPGKDQRVYFLNTKEIVGNKYGTANPVPFRVVDNNIGLDIDISIRCHGEYSYKIVDPILFYTNVCGNVEYDYTRDTIDSQLKTELMTALQPAFAKISSMGIRYSALPGHTLEIAQVLNEVLSEKWTKLRGIAVASFGISSVKASDEDEKMIKDLQKTSVLRNTSMAAATLTNAQAEAMKSAASNTSTGSMMAFAGMNMAQNIGGLNAQDLFAMSKQQVQTNNEINTAQISKPPMESKADNVWICSCGAENEGKFCMECGQPKPQLNCEWKCSCGAINKGKFCTECGAKKPESKKIYKCNKCGWEPENKEIPPKFCPECGDRFDDLDIQ